MSSILPADIEAAVADFMRAEKTGSVTLHIHRGNVQKVAITESMEIQRGTKAERG